MYGFKPYSETEIINTLSPLKITEHNNIIRTTYNNITLSESTVSDKYMVFDFTKFSNIILKKIEKYFIPEKYNLKIDSVQELKLIGEEFNIKNEKYYKMLTILSSSNKTRSLQMNIGLLRQVCTNGMVVGVENESISIKNKHFKASLPDKVAYFVENLKKFNIVIDYQKDIINKIDDNDISYKYVLQKLLYDDNKIKYLKSNESKVNLLSQLLLYSYTDKLDTSFKNKLNRQQLFLLHEPIKNYNSIEDIDIPKSKIFNCYIEGYKTKDSSIIKRETNRILSILN